MRIHDQSLVVAAYKGAPIRFHWSVILGMAYFGGFQYAPGFWLGYCLLVLLHELGHGFLVQRFDLKIKDIVVHGFGGYCKWQGRATRLQDAVIAWGGVIAQTILLIITLLVLFFHGQPQTDFGYQLAQVLIRTNLILIGLNLLPIPPLDGASAWRLVPILVAKAKRRKHPKNLRGLYDDIDLEFRNLELRKKKNQTRDPSDHDDDARYGPYRD